MCNRKKLTRLNGRATYNKKIPLDITQTDIRGAKTVPAFESAYFNMENKSTSKGTVQIEIKEESGNATGSVNNKMSCNLENCLLFHNGSIYYIGSLNAGQAINLADTAIYSILPDKSKDAGNKDSVVNVAYEYDLEDITGTALDGKDTSNELKRRICMILDFASSNKAGSTWFYGFVQYGGETGFEGYFMYNSYGETGVYKYLN